MFINMLRKNIGTIVAMMGFILLSIITFGDLGEIMTKEYWLNVKNNLTSIGFMSISLTMIQVTIKQGLGEQALQRGLNTENTSNKYKEHKNLIQKCNEKILYLPYFLQIYNERHTLLKKREFLANNGYVSEELFLRSAKKSAKKKYDKLRVCITMSSIKWATTDIVYSKNGQIETLADHRRKRIAKGILLSLIFMIGATFITQGLFFNGNNTIPLWQKFVKLLSYVVTIALTSVLAVIKEYEKGAFSVPNELDEINEIWVEFKNWEIPNWVLKEVEELNNKNEVRNEERKETINERTVIQEEQENRKNVDNLSTSNNVDLSCSCTDLLLLDNTKLNR